MKIVFMGTPDFSAVCLSALAETEHEIVGVICQPDKPFGRKRELKAPEVKLEANRHGFRVFQPQTLRNGEGVKILEELRPDIAVVVAYGKLLPSDFLSFPKYGCINVHASLLPKYRGASPIHWAVINGETETGVTVMQMDEGLDTGDILTVKKCPVGIDDTTEDMYEKLAPIGAQALIETLKKIESGTVCPVRQNEAEATKVGLLSKEMSRIDWNDTALNIHNKIRGLYSWPCTVSTVCGRSVKIYRSKLIDEAVDGKNGEIVFADKRLVVRCGDGKCVELTELQLEGKKRMTACDLLNGFRLQKGDMFE